jgi:hypothetical protein
MFRALILAGVLLARGASAADAPCRSTWAPGEYKSYGQVQNELRERQPTAHVLRIALCGEGEDAYFQVLILDDGNHVSTIQVEAKR